MPSRSFSVTAGMSYASQCVNGFGFAASGSSTITTNDFVPSGALLHSNAGEAF
ncbi:hypothetical protein D3C87_1940660 [compost metagenome]